MGNSRYKRYSFCTLLFIFIMAIAKVNKKVVGKKTDKKVKKTGKRSWGVYVNRTLKAAAPKMTMSSRAKKIVCSFVDDMFDRLATEAAALARNTKKATLGSREVQTAVRLTLPVELARHAMSEGTRAIAKLS